ERQLRTVLDSLPIGVWFTDRTGKTLLANPAAKQIWSNIKQVGLHSKENPSGWWETLEPANEPHRWALSHALTTGEASLNETLDLEDLNGRTKTIRNTTVPVKDESGTTLGAVILNEDLTDLRRIQEALKLTQFSVDHAVEGFFWLNHRGEILNVNESACRMLEYTHEELTTMTIHDIDPHILSDNWPAHWEELKRRGSLTFESKHWSKTGQVLDTKVSVNYLHYDGHEYNCAIIRNITERKRAEAALRSSEARFRLLVEGAPLGIAIMDQQKRYVKVNQALCSLVGYLEEELLGQTFALFTHPDDLALNVAQTDALYSTSHPGCRIEKRYVRKTGETIWVTVNATSLAFPEEHEQHIIAIIEDTTDKKRAEQALRESQTRLTEAQRIAHIGSWELNLPENRLTWSEEVYRIFEVDPRRFGGSYEAFLKLVHPDDRDLVDLAYRKSVAARTPYNVVHRLLLPDGRMKFVRERCETFYTQDGQPLRSLGTIQDITEQKRTEEALQQREQDLRDAMEERERISQDLHDGILQSLYAIGLGLESCKPLIKQRTDKKATDLLEQAVSQMNHVMTEVRNFIAGLDPDVHQGGEFSAALHAMVQKLIASHPIHCRLAIDEPSVSHLSTEQALHLMNIVREAISNSLRHGHATKATVSLKPLAHSIRLTIRDNGTGFVPADVSGLGHGLSNMEARARKVGGRFAIRSVPQHGTRITIDLPKEYRHAESESEHGSTAARR
ncbi:MAG: PAS domain S-box protein, partial [Nitrospira sp.]|nr:PAS domain S-box protein [Nitrospira sp.]